MLGGILVIVLVAVMGAWAFHLVARRPIFDVVPLLTNARLTSIAGRFVGNLVLAVAQASDIQATPDGKEVPPLREVRGLSMSWDGSRIYAADPGNGIVTVFDRDGKPLRILGQDGPGKLRGPGAVAEAPDGRIFVTDRLANRLVIYDHDGNYIGDFSPTNMPPSFSLVPISLAFERGGTLYVGDGNGAVYVFDRSGSLSRRLAPPEGRFEAPWGVAVNASGLVAITDSSHQRAFVFREDGTVLGILGGQSGAGVLSLPRGVAMDNRGRVFVSDALAHRVQAFSSDGRFLGYFGEEGNLDGQFSYPEGVVVDNQGVLYAADRGNKRIQIWRY